MVASTPARDLPLLPVGPLIDLLTGWVTTGADAGPEADPGAGPAGDAEACAGAARGGLSAVPHRSQ
ncbi:hypothetical protein [Nonomuraea sp. B5E05]|uniref:hypothetical protein n=1 Tax=Nonomuraea sp. B5E05 TaxID=3153569 RepID=UPI0032604B3F